MDYGLIGGVNPPDPSAGGPMSFAAFEPARRAMGDTRRFADRMRLIDMEPRDDLSSTGYALANPGREYLVLHTGGADGSFTVLLKPGIYSGEWFGIDSRQTTEAGQVAVKRDEHLNFTVPWPQTEPAVLYLRRATRDAPRARNSVGMADQARNGADRELASRFRDW
jgi:hypothetical protein